MAIQHGKLVENGECMENQEFRTPLIVQKEGHIRTCKAHDCEANIVKSKSGGSVKMVLLSIYVAVCGSFEFGSCVGYSAPTQSAIREDLKLSLAQVISLLSSFPIHVKGVAGSFVVLVCWACASAVSYTFNLLMSWSPSGTFLLYSGFSLLTILFVAKVVPETKGKTLEEIQASINRN